MKKILLPLLLFTQFAAQAQRTGTDYAVFFYATDFQPGWAALPETAKEATELKTELETNFGFTCEAVANPSKAQILAKIKTYNDRLTANDQVLFFFSMHGHYEETAERGFLIAADGAVQDEYGETWLSYDDLSGFLARCKAKHVLLALDACHSGAFGIRNKARPDVPTYSQAEDCNQRVAKTFQFQGRQFCTSGNKSSKTPAKSLFASRFLEALRKGGQDGIIRFDDLEYYLGKVENPRPENGTFKNHAPGGDFVFVKKGGCANEKKEIYDSTVVERDGEKAILASILEKKSFQVIAEYTPRFGKKSYFPLDFENPIKEAAKLGSGTKLDVQLITRLLIIGTFLIKDDANRLRGEIILKSYDGSIRRSVFVDFVKQSEKIGEYFVFECRYNDASLIWLKTGRRKKSTILNNNKFYTIDMICKDQIYSVKFNFD